MGTDIHPAVEYRDKHGIWHYHQPKSLCRFYYETRYDPSTMQFVTERDAHGEPIRSKWDQCKYDLPWYFTNRNYMKFAILAGVRDYGNEVPHIDEPRGRPIDISKNAEQKLSDEHSDTWVTLKDILDFDYTQTFDDGSGPVMLRDCDAGQELMLIAAYMSALIPKDGTTEDVRLVMDFDS